METTKNITSGYVDGPVLLNTESDTNTLIKFLFLPSMMGVTISRRIHFQHQQQNDEWDVPELSRRQLTIAAVTFRKVEKIDVVSTSG